MKIYDEAGMELVSPDPEKGWLELSRRETVRHEARPARPEKAHLERLPGTDGLRCRVIDEPASPAREAWSEYEPVEIYHPYTPEQLAQRRRPGLEERLTAAENALLELLRRGGGDRA